MAWQLLNRRYTIGTVDGSGDITPGSAQTGFQDFTALTSGNTTYVVAVQGSTWSFMTVSKVGAILRPGDTHDSSTGAAITFDSGQPISVFSDLGSSKIVYEDGDGTAQNATSVLRTFSPEILTALKTTPLPSTGKSVALLRNIVAGDGKGAIYTWDPDETATGDDFNYVVSGLSATGRWVREKPLTEIKAVSADSDAYANSIYSVSDQLRRKRTDTTVKKIAEHTGDFIDSYATLALLLAETIDDIDGRPWADGQFVQYRGIATEGDITVPRIVEWDKDSTNTDSLGVNFHRPDGITGSNAGRFKEQVPVRAAKFANSDATPSVKGGIIFTCADTVPAAITTFDEMRDGQEITVQPGAQDQLFTDSANFNVGGSDFTLLTTDAPVRFYKENGVVNIIGGAGGASDYYDTLTALKAASLDADTVYHTKGRSSVGDGGEGQFNWVATDYSARLVTSTKAVTAINGTNDQVTVTGHGWRNGMGVVSSAASGGMDTSTIYYARVIDANTVTLHATASGALSDSGKVDLSSASGFNLKSLLDPAGGVYVIPDGKALDGSEGVMIRLGMTRNFDVRWFGATLGASDETDIARAAAYFVNTICSLDTAGATLYVPGNLKAHSLLDDLVLADGMFVAGDGPEKSMIWTDQDAVNLLYFGGEKDKSTPIENVGAYGLTLESTVTSPTSGDSLVLYHVNQPWVDKIEFRGGHRNFHCCRVARAFFGETYFKEGSRTTAASGSRCVLFRSDSAIGRNNTGIHWAKLECIQGAADANSVEVGMELKNIDGIYVVSAHFNGTQYPVWLNPDDTENNDTVFSVRFGNLYCDQCHLDGFTFKGGSATTDYRIVNVEYGEISASGRDGVVFETDDVVSEVDLAFNIIKNVDNLAVNMKNDEPLNTRLRIGTFRNNNVGNTSGGGDILIDGTNTQILGDPVFEGGGANGTAVEFSATAVNATAQLNGVTNSSAGTKIDTSAAAAGEVRIIGELLAGVSAPVKGDVLKIARNDHAGITMQGAATKQITINYATDADAFVARTQFDDSDDTMTHEIEASDGAHILRIGGNDIEEIYGLNASPTDATPTTVNTLAVGENEVVYLEADIALISASGSVGGAMKTVACFRRDGSASPVKDNTTDTPTAGEVVEQKTNAGTVLAFAISSNNILTQVTGTSGTTHWNGILRVRRVAVP